MSKVDIVTPIIMIGGGLLLAAMVVFGVMRDNAEIRSEKAFRAECLEANNKYEYTDSYDLLCRSKTGEVTKVWRYD
jgi:hypothetical protein